MSDTGYILMRPSVRQRAETALVPRPPRAPCAATARGGRAPGAAAQRPAGTPGGGQTARGAGAPSADARRHEAEARAARHAARHALCMVLHPRLGARAAGRVLGRRLLGLIFAAQARPRRRGPAYGHPKTSCVRMPRRRAVRERCRGRVPTAHARGAQDRPLVNLELLAQRPGPPPSAGAELRVLAVDCVGRGARPGSAPASLGPDSASQSDVVSRSFVREPMLGPGARA